MGYGTVIPLLSRDLAPSKGWEGGRDGKEVRKVYKVRRNSSRGLTRDSLGRTWGRSASIYPFKSSFSKNEDIGKGKDSPEV